MAFQVPQNVQDYFWKLLMTGAFVLGTALATKYLGAGSASIPAPPTIQVQPVIVGSEKDGTMRILNVESPLKK